MTIKQLDVLAAALVQHGGSFVFQAFRTLFLFLSEYLLFSSKTYRGREADVVGLRPRTRQDEVVVLEDAGHLRVVVPRRVPDHQVRKPLRVPV